VYILRLIQGWVRSLFTKVTWLPSITDPDLAVFAGVKGCNTGGVGIDDGIDESAVRAICCSLCYLQSPKWPPQSSLKAVLESVICRNATVLLRNDWETDMYLYCWAQWDKRDDEDAPEVGSTQLWEQERRQKKNSEGVHQRTGTRS
jgi:hypothetical protein